VLAKCRQCVRIHLDKARALGLTEAEIDEAVWMAVAFGGAPALMFYQSARGE
jgi:alkylhydroperoxidase/carboxymuconolactone decarboxylase family protein YurZ